MSKHANPSRLGVLLSFSRWSGRGGQNATFARIRPQQFFRDWPWLSRMVVALMWLALPLSQMSLQGATYYWDGSLGVQWGNPVNWSTSPDSASPDPLGAPGFGDIAVFDVTTLTAPQSVFLSGDRSVQGLTFWTATPTFLLSGGSASTLSLGLGGIQMTATSGFVGLGVGMNPPLNVSVAGGQSWINDSGNALWVTGGVSGTANSGDVQTLRTAGAGSAVLSGVISDGSFGGALSILKSGAGQLDLLHTRNTYSGALTVSGGTLNVFSLLDAPGAGGNGGGNITLGDLDENIPVTLRYSGIASANVLGRVIQIASATAGVTIDSNGAMPMILGTLSAITPGAKTLTLQGNNTLNNEVRGPVGDTGIGALSITKAGSGVWFLSNTNNNFSGQLEVQQGRLSLSALGDSLNGTGTIRMGNGANAGTLRYVGAGNASTSRVVDMAGTTGGATIEVTGAGTLNLSSFGVSGLGSKTLTLAGDVLGNPNYLSGNIVDNGGATAVTKSGIGTWVLSGSNSYTGGTSITAGVLRVTNSNALGNSNAFDSVDSTGGGLLDFRSDTSMAFDAGYRMYNHAMIYVDRAIGGTGVGNTVSMGTLTVAVQSNNLTLAGAHGYGLNFTGGLSVPLTGAAIYNYLSANGVQGYAPGALTLNGLSASAGSTTTVVFGGWGDYWVNGGGNISGATTVNITRNTQGLVTFTGNGSGWNPTTPGTITSSLGVTRVDSSNPAVLGNFNLSLSGGLGEVRSDSSTDWSSKTLSVGAASLLVDRALGGTGTGNTLTVGSLRNVADNNTAYFVGNHGYSLNASTVISDRYTIHNYLAGGVLNLGTTAINRVSLGVATPLSLSVNGPGDTVIGSLTEGGTTPNTALNKLGSGILTLSGSNTLGGAVTLSQGVLRITHAGALGGTGGTLVVTGNGPGNSGVDLRSDTSMDLSGRPMGNVYGAVFNVDRALSGSGTAQTMTLGGGLGLGNNSWSNLVMGANGYSLRFGSSAPVNVAVAAGNIASTFWNFIPNVSGNGRVEFAGGISFINSASTSSLTLGGWGDYLLSGPLTYTAGGTSSALLKSGVGTLTISSDSAATFNHANATITMSGGITRLTSATGLGGALATVNLNGGMLDLRSDSSLTLAPTLVVGAGGSFLNVDRAVGGTGTGG
ncbi:MAG: hypothetical protein RLZZ399_2372, partial [Verrucomicrobiota bacterium]